MISRVTGVWTYPLFPPLRGSLIAAPLRDARGHGLALGDRLHANHFRDPFLEVALDAVLKRLSGARAPVTGADEPKLDHAVDDVYELDIPTVRLEGRANQSDGLFNLPTNLIHVVLTFRWG